MPVLILAWLTLIRLSAMGVTAEGMIILAYATLAAIHANNVPCLTAYIILIIGEIRLVRERHFQKTIQPEAETGQAVTNDTKEAANS